MEYSSLDDVPHSARMNLQQQQQQQHQLVSPAFSIITDSSPHQTQTSSNLHSYVCVYVYAYVYVDVYVNVYVDVDASVEVYVKVFFVLRAPFGAASVVPVQKNCDTA